MWGINVLKVAHQWGIRVVFVGYKNGDGGEA